LANETDDDNIIASIHPNEQMYEAQLRLGYAWARDLSEAEQAEILVHEMCHLLHTSLENVVRISLFDSKYLPQAAYDLLMSQFKLETEKMTDHFTQLICKYCDAVDRWHYRLSQAERARRAERRAAAPKPRRKRR
jgi:hypothetical protein